MRGPRRRDGAPRAPQGGRVPPAVRRRRPGPRLPARLRGRQDGPVGAGRVRHPGCAGLPVRGGRGGGPRDAGDPAADAHPRPLAARCVGDRGRGAVARAERAAHGAEPDGPQLEGRADPRRRPAGQPARGPARRHRGRGGAPQGPPAVRTRDADPFRALPDRRAGHGPAGGGPGLSRAAGSVMKKGPLPKQRPPAGVLGPAEGGMGDRGSPPPWPL
ncbi:hypothetical protein MICRO116_110007 [Micrococcus sp. 116]|nr:hypothetical protein MICRO116_110007 [Micrococcus sp. 116]